MKTNILIIASSWLGSFLFFYLLFAFVDWQLNWYLNNPWERFLFAILSVLFSCLFSDHFIEESEKWRIKK